MSYYRKRKPEPPHASITAAADGRIKWQSNFDRQSLDTMKELIPWFAREWNKPDKCWLIEPQFMTDLINLASLYHHSNLTPIPLNQRIMRPFRVKAQLMYIGAPKMAGGIEYCSGKGINDQWYRYAFIDNSMREWFEPGKTIEPDAEQTWYEILGILKSATPEEVKKGFRMASMTWHPDRNKDPAAHDMFIAIKAAYDGLSEPATRAKYDAFLTLQASIPKKRDGNPYKKEWRPPVRCGELTISGNMAGQAYLVNKIEAWQPIVNAAGMTMVSQWDKALNEAVVTWI